MSIGKTLRKGGKKLAKKSVKRRKASSLSGAFIARGKQAKSRRHILPV